MTKLDRHKLSQRKSNHYTSNDNSLKRSFSCQNHDYSRPKDIKFIQSAPIKIVSSNSPISPISSISSNSPIGEEPELKVNLRDAYEDLGFVYEDGENQKESISQSDKFLLPRGYTIDSDQLTVETSSTFALSESNSAESQWSCNSTFWEVSPGDESIRNNELGLCDFSNEFGEVLFDAERDVSNDVVDTPQIHDSRLVAKDMFTGEVVAMIPLCLSSNQNLVAPTLSGKLHTSIHALHVESTSDSDEGGTLSVKSTSLAESPVGVVSGSPMSTSSLDSSDIEVSAQLIHMDSVHVGTFRSKVLRKASLSHGQDQMREIWTPLQSEFMKPLNANPALPKSSLLRVSSFSGNIELAQMDCSSQAESFKPLGVNSSISIWKNYVKENGTKMESIMKLLSPYADGYLEFFSHL